MLLSVLLNIVRSTVVENVLNTEIAVIRPRIIGMSKREKRKVNKKNQCANLCCARDGYVFRFRLARTNGKKKKVSTKVKKKKKMEEIEKFILKTDVVYLFKIIIIARCACDITVAGRSTVDTNRCAPAV